jgi:hypothetical protein
MPEQALSLQGTSSVKMDRAVSLSLPQCLEKEERVAQAEVMDE